MGLREMTEAMLEELERHRRSERRRSGVRGGGREG
jgi:hypothetical protein